MSYKKANIDDLISTVKTLRGPQGCPWDRKQSTATMCKYLQAEFEELLAAIGNNDTENICEEIGDLLFVLVMITEIERESGHFSFDQVISGINEKLIRRHPHVFGDVEISSEQELRAQWDKIKQQEKRGK